MTDPQTAFAPPPRGVVAAAATAFTPSGEIAEAPTLRLWEHLLTTDARGARGSCDALAPFGTTGEGPSLDTQERAHLLHAATKAGIPTDRLWPGVGDCVAGEVRRRIRDAGEHGCAGVLLLPPFFYKGISADGLRAWLDDAFEHAARAHLRILLYNIPQASGVAVPPELAAHFATAPAFGGVKDSSGSAESLAAYRDALKGTPASVLVGDDALLSAHLDEGGAGCILASANLAAPLAHIVCDTASTTATTTAAETTATATTSTTTATTAAETTATTARRAQAQTLLGGVRTALRARGAVASVKHLLARTQGDDTWRTPRLPLVPLSKQDAHALEADWDALKLQAQEHDLPLA